MNFPSHYPAHESLQEFAARTGKSPREAHAQWSDRSYPAFSIMRKEDVFDSVTEQKVGTESRRVYHDAYGPGLPLRASDIQ